MMKHRHWPRHLALSAIAAAFAAPLAHAQVGNSNAVDTDSRAVMTGTGPLVDSSGAAVERTLPFVPFPLTNRLDVMKGNDVRDARDSTILRNDVPVPDPSMPIAYAGSGGTVAAASGPGTGAYSGSSGGAATARSEPLAPTAAADRQTDTRTDASTSTSMNAATDTRTDAASDERMHAANGTRSDITTDTHMDSTATDTHMDSTAANATAGAAVADSSVVSDDTALTSAPAVADSSVASGDTALTSGPAVMGSGISRASEVIGAQVRDPQGQELGKIKDLVLDPGHGRIRYAVLSYGGSLGMGDKLYAVPWDSLQPAADGKYVLAVPHDQLRAAQGFDQDKWPDMADERWHTQTYGHYGQEPYWTAGDVGRDPNAQDTAAIVGGPRGVGGGAGGGAGGGGAGGGGAGGGGAGGGGAGGGGGGAGR